MEGPERIYPPRLRDIEEQEEQGRLERQGRGRRRLLMLLLFVGLVASVPIVLGLLRQDRVVEGQSAESPELVGLPQEMHVQVEVLNASDIEGAASAMADRLRAAGFDVPSIGNANEPEPYTIIIDRRGDSIAVGYLRKSLDLPPGRIRRWIDSSRHVSATVIVGRGE